MAKHSHDYKYADENAQRLEIEYKTRLATAKSLFRKSDIKKDKDSHKKYGTPKVYDGLHLGLPEATREWHMETAQYAKRAADEWDRYVKSPKTKC
jgi:hypothetical protein